MTRADLSAAQEDRAEAAEKREQALIQLVEELRAWARACQELEFPDVDVFDELVKNEAAGVLDAWVRPTGAVAGHDVFAVPDAVPPVPGQSLSGVLVPELDAPVPADVVERLLAGGVAYGDRAPAGHPAAVGADGSWRLGNLSGSWQKPHAAHIGAVARERPRERRMRELRAQSDQVDTVFAGLVSRLEAIQTRRSMIRPATRRAPLVRRRASGEGLVDP